MSSTRCLGAFASLSPYFWPAGRLRGRNLSAAPSNASTDRVGDPAPPSAVVPATVVSLGSRPPPFFGTCSKLLPRREAGVAKKVLETCSPKCSLPDRALDRTCKDARNMFAEAFWSYPWAPDAGVDQIRQTLTDNCPNRANFCRNWPNMAPFGPKLVKVGPVLVEVCTWRP